MSEKKRKYDLEQAHEEANQLKSRILFERAKDYDEAQQQVDDELKKKEERRLERVKNSIIQAIGKYPFGDIIFSSSEERDLILSQNLPEITEAKQRKAEQLLERGDWESLESLEAHFGNLGDNFMQQEETRVHVRNGLIAKLKKEMRSYSGHEALYHNIHEAMELVEKLAITKEEIDLPEVQEALRVALLNKVNDNKPRIYQKTIDFFNISDELIQSPDIQLAIKEQLIHVLADHSYRSEIGEIVEMSQLDKSREIQNTTEVYEALREWTLSAFDRGISEKDYQLMKDTFDKFEDLVYSPEVKKVIKRRLLRILESGSWSNCYEAKILGDDKITSDEDFLMILKKSFTKAFARNRFGIENAKAISDYFDVSDFINSPEVQDSIKKVVLQILTSDGFFHIENIELIREEFGVSEEISNDPEIQQAVAKKFASQLSEGNLNNVELIGEIFNIPLPLSLDDVTRLIFQTNSGQVIAENLENKIFQTYREKILQQLGPDYYSTYAEKINEVLSDNQDFILTNEDIGVLETGTSKLDHISYPELNVLRRKDSLNTYSLADDESAEKIYFELRNQEAPEWRDDVICGHFEEGAKVFGYSRMFDFARPGSRHDALYAFDRIVEMCEKSGLNEKQFYNNILRQTAKDGGVLEIEGDELEWSDTQTPYQRLNDITSSFRFDFDKIFEEAKGFKIEQLQKLVNEIEEPKNIFNSWQMLQNYHELTKMLERKQLMLDLETEPNKKLKNYVATLAFHPTIENMTAVMNFWRKPEVFLELPSSHTPKKFTTVKNLVTIQIFQILIYLQKICEMCW